MKKRIIICCDGTWNEPENIKDEVKVPTNILKTVRAVTPFDEKNNITQVIFYNEGVGTGSIGLADRMIGGGLGAGISANIQSAYRFLANNYRQGDEIFLFGFSRGAYTARSLSGMLEEIGLLDKTDLRYVPEAYEYYHIEPDKRIESKFHNLLEDLPRQSPKVKFLGVFDTVGSLGVPTPILGRIQNWAGQKWRLFRVGFHDCSLSKSVDYAYQALALDEHRGPFRPAIWDKLNGQIAVQQVWFSGVHSNIGGGYPDCGISDTAMKWLMNRAMECGLAMDKNYIDTRIKPDPLGKLEDSYSMGYKILERLRVKPHQRIVGEHLGMGEMIHESVLKRICSDQQPLYRPVNIAPPEQIKSLADNANDFITINGKRIPVVHERKAQRVNAELSEAEFNLPGQPVENCNILDFSEAHGARLKLNKHLDVGSEVHLNSTLTGEHDAVIIWEHGGEAGLRYNA